MVPAAARRFWNMRAISPLWVALVASCAVACGGGAQLQVRGASFHLSGREAGLAARYEEQDPTAAPPADRCGYWQRVVGDASGDHVIGILKWPAEYFDQLRTWAAAKRDEACTPHAAREASAQPSRLPGDDFIEPEADAAAAKSEPVPANFCGEICSPDSRSCFAQGLAANNLKRTDVGTSCDQLASIMLWCTVMKIRCEKYCGPEGVRGFAATNAADPVPRSCNAPKELAITNAERQAVVRDSVAAYMATGRSCACPYNSARNGSSCGGRSAYNRPGGASPLCYPSDVTDEMVLNWRRTHIGP
jgi:hypothetical protein